MKVSDDNMCFACGLENPIGLKLYYELDEQKQAFCKFTLDKVFQGYTDIIHGGILSTILDETMVKAAHLGYNFTDALTARLEIAFKSPAKVGEELIAYGRVIEVRRRIISTEGEILNINGDLIANAKGTLIRVKQK